MNRFLKWLVPHESNFFGLFNAHIKVASESAKELLAIVSDGPGKAASICRVRELEHEADVITQRCIEELHKTFITPFQRDDIYRMVSMMDDIVDYIEEVSTRFAIYQINEMTPNAKALTKILAQAIEVLVGVFALLHDHSNLGALKQSLRDVRKLESEGDTAYILAIGSLFQDFEDPCMIIKWKEIYENLEQAIDSCKKVADIVEGVILESF